MTARSVLASTLLGADPAELPVAQLVSVAGLFGVSENSVRVALSRMVTAGELSSAQGHYRLSGHLVERHRRQRQSRTPRLEPWEGRWEVVVIVEPRPDAATRLAARRALAAARLGERREGVWMRPANLAIDIPAPMSTSVEQMRAEMAGDPRARAAGLWDLGEWAVGARRLLDRLEATFGDLDDTRALAPGFVLSASVLRHLQADPLLPLELLPARWPGTRLRSRYDAWDTAYRSLLRRHHLGAANPDR